MLSAKRFGRVTSSIDTAEGYQNEAGVGAAIRQGDVARENLFIASKLRNGAHLYDDALRAFDRTMQELQLEVLDLFLIHWPLPRQGKYVEAWKALVQLQKDGRIRSIGVSNFYPEHIERIIAETGVSPVVNQIELHPSFQQRAVREFHRQHDILIESWSPLGQGSAMKHPALAFDRQEARQDPGTGDHSLASRRTAGRHPEIGDAEPDSGEFRVFDFKLDADDLARIAVLDDPRGRMGADPRTADSGSSGQLAVVAVDALVGVGRTRHLDLLTLDVYLFTHFGGLHGN